MQTHRKPRIAYPHALPGTCKHCGHPTNKRRSRSHETCREKYSEKVSYRAAAERREGKYQRCVDCNRVNGEWVTVNGRQQRVKVTRDHVVALALRGPHEWTAPRCGPCHQKKTTDDNRRTKQWRDRAPRRPRDRRTMSTAKNSPSRKSGGGAAAMIGRFLAGIVLIGGSLLWMTGKLGAVTSKAPAAHSVVGWLEAAGVAVVVLAVLYGLWRWRKAHREDQIYRIKDVLSQEMRCDPTQVRVKVRRWTWHQMPVVGQFWYTTTFAEDDPVERAKVEAVLQRKIGYRLDVRWDYARDTFRWRPAADQAPQDAAPPDPVAQVEPTAEEAAAATVDRLTTGIESVLGKGVAVEISEWHTKPDDTAPDGARRTTPQSITITYPASAKVHDEKTVDDVEDKVASLLEGRWRPEWDTRNDLVVFTDTPDPLADIVSGLPLAEGAPVGRPAIGRLENGALWQIPFEKETPHLLIAGASGAGKGSVLWSLIRSLIPGVLAGTATIWGIDPKGIELVQGKGVFEKYTATVDGAIKMLDQALEFLDTRKTQMASKKLRDFTESPGDPRLFILIDEIAALTLYGIDKKTAKEIIDKLGLIVTQGRALGVHLVAALQDPRKEVLKIRDLFAGKLALRLGAAAECDLVMGNGARSAGARADKIPLDMPGISYMMIDGKPAPQRGRAGWVDDKEIGRMEALVSAARAAGSIPLFVISTIRRSIATTNQISPTRRRRRTSRHRPLWNLVPVDDLRDTDVIILELDGQAAEVEMEGPPVESPDDSLYVEIAWKGIGGRKGVASIEANSMIERRPA